MIHRIVVAWHSIGSDLWPGNGPDNDRTRSASSLCAPYVPLRNCKNCKTTLHRLTSRPLAVKQSMDSVKLALSSHSAHWSSQLILTFRALFVRPSGSSHYTLISDVPLAAGSHFVTVSCDPTVIQTVIERCDRLIGWPRMQVRLLNAIANHSNAQVGGSLRRFVVANFAS